TDDRNSHLVTNNLKIFFVPDPLKFPHILHPFNPDPLSNLPPPLPIFHFLSPSPQATHIITFLFSPSPIPPNYPQIHPPPLNTYQSLNPQ
ncbi:catalase, partial [Paenibacillus sp. Y412MC10]|uniref:catalase n=1 Tax=Geobacillus sp. (strain Y412MC10) TaxID=481743 RepID=UPI0011A50A57